MPDLQPHAVARLTARADQGLIAVISERDGHDVVEYFADDSGDESVQEASRHEFSMAGVWRDIDSDDFLDGLDRLRHESKPTPPITLPELDL